MSIEGKAGNFTAKVHCLPRYVDKDRCTACGTCADYCPVPIRDDYNEGLCLTKAVHMDYQQAIPAAFHVDANACLFLTNQECKQCEKVCQAKAIDFKQQAQDIELNVGAVVLALGFGRISKEVLSRYGYGISPNVITSTELERILSASGPFRSHLIRPSDQKEPKKIAWLQCVGSRDVNYCDNGYCSSVCCMYAIKEAVIAREHSKDPLDTAIFFIDMRTYGKEFEQYYNRARESGVRFVRCRVHTIDSVVGSDNLEIRYVTEDGRVENEEFDMVVLSVGLESTPGAAELAEKLGIDLDHNEFARTSSFAPVSTSAPGIYACGAFQGPKDIPYSVMEASAA
ncbi:MAG: CoB--CoM heterodisulfide reductase iron-sulfur subunit A family protein, partial [Desulfobacterales bacterium]|nr:CoB--CoM heterodisulfide reductase iron-sulfur subunit A family protein [Desulfobacterales bacterium]